VTTYESDLEYFGGDIIFATDINAVIASLPKVYTKTSATARQSTTTLTADPDLSGITLDVGVYDIELILFWTCANTTPKLKTRWGFSGTITNTLRLCHGPGSTQTGGPEAVSDATMRAYALTSQDAIYSTILEAVYGAEVTVAGDLSLNWAQNVSTAANVTVQPESAFRIRKIS
jgi:hypothetical protein